MEEDHILMGMGANRRPTGLGVSFFNIPTLVRESDFWTMIASENGITLQQNVITGHARIINAKRIRIAWGDMRAMKKAFGRLVKPWEKCSPGDILAIQRANGLYFHYAVYIGNGRVIHYAAEGSDFGMEPYVHEADFREFLCNDTCYEILNFSETGNPPEHKIVNLVSDMGMPSKRCCYDAISDVDRCLRKIKGYHVYSPKETIQRAKSRIGENKYNLALNNCEHFALWCKTGVRESTQVEAVIKHIILGVTQISESAITDKYSVMR